jgi:hypothetical protein
MIRMHSSANLTLVLLIVAIGVTPAATASTVDQWGSLQLLSREIAAGTSSKFSFIPDRSYEASYLNMPVFVARGAAPGPVLVCRKGRRSWASVVPRRRRAWRRVKRRGGGETRVRAD